MLATVIDMVEAVAALPAPVAQQALEMAGALARRPGNGQDTVSQVGDGSQGAEVVTRLLTLIRTIGDTPSAEVADMAQQCESRHDLTGVIAAQFLVLASCASFSPAATVPKAINLIRDLAMLPVEIAASTRVLGGELALPGPQTLAAIDWLRQRGCATADIEAWRAAGDMPEVVDTSVYEDGCRHASDWTAYVSCCALGATEFVEIYATAPEMLFNCFWKCPEAPAS